MTRPPRPPGAASDHSAADELPMTDSADDYPEVGTVLDLLPASRGDALMSWLDDLDDEELLVSIPRDSEARPVSLAVGEHIEVIWKADGTLRCLPVVLSGLDLGDSPQLASSPSRCGEAGTAPRGSPRAHECFGHPWRGGIGRPRHVAGLERRRPALRPGQGAPPNPSTAGGRTGLRPVCVSGR